MIPMVAIVAIRTKPLPSPRWWIPLPLFLMWLLLLPFILILLPFVFIACWVIGVDPLRALSASWELLSGLRNAHIEVDHRQASILIRFH